MYNSCFVVLLRSYVQLFDPMSCSTPGSSVLHYLLEYAQTHIHWVGDTIQPSHLLWPPYPLPSVFPSIRVFSNESALCIRWTEYWALASVLPMIIQGWFPFGLTGLISLLSKELSRVFSSSTVAAAAAAKSLQSCPTLCDPIDGSPPGSGSWDSPGKNTGVGCHFLLQRMKVKSESEVAQSYSTLRDPMDCSLPGSSIHGIFQARVLEWGAIAFSEHNS